MSSDEGKAVGHSNPCYLMISALHLTPFYLEVIAAIVLGAC